jgi:transcriptional regulator with XRE-family HTH domain
MASAPPLGVLLKDWRQRRRMSQLDLALEAGVSARHLSFLETGRSNPSREMVLHLAEELEVPLRERNRMLLAAGYAPAYDERPLDAPELEPVRRAVAQVLTGIEPFPAAVIDRWWNLVASNRHIGVFLEGVAPELLEPPVNTLRVSLHPRGLAPRIENLAEYGRHIVTLVHRAASITADPVLDDLEAELRGYPGVADDDGPEVEPTTAVFVPLQLRTEQGVLSFFSTIATFGTALDITLAELAIESFFPADPATAAALSG